MKILLLEDDNSLQKGIELKLSKEMHQVVCADTIFTARQKINTEEQFDMAILDLNIPDGSGLDICKELRESKNTPHILILTSNDTEIDIILGYETGADDYMTKPFSLSVLLSKINAVERRIESVGKDKDNNKGKESLPENLIFDSAKQTIDVRGQTVLLTRNEWRLLYALWENRGKIIKKESLINSLWDIDGDFVDENTLAVNIRRLREKIEINPSEPVIIENVRGVGYKLNKSE